MTKERLLALLIAETRELLGVADVHETDDFLALGGDSLSALLLAEAVERLVAHAVDVEIFFEQPTLSAIADVIVLADAREGE